MAGALRTLIARTFGPRTASPDALRQVKAWATAALNPGPEATITVNEIACMDPSCPGFETVILLLQPGQKTRAYKVGKPADRITEQDVRAALVG